MMGTYANPVADKERIGVAKKALVALGVVAIMVVAMAVVAGPAHAQSTTNTITVNSLEDTTANDGKCTLREAIASANNNTASGAASGECAAGSSTGSDVIDIEVTGTVQLTGALPNLSSNMQIEGPGADRFTVRRSTGGDYRIFAVTSGSVVSISGITIANGNRPFEGGGGILNNGGTLTISDSTISGNSTRFGGGIYNSHGILTISGSTISGNSADSGGGIVSLTNLSGTQNTTITNSTISGNSATTRGGGVYNFDGLSVIEHSTITNNTAPDGSGSGVASNGNSATRTEVLSTIVSANTNTDGTDGTDVDLTDDTTNSFDSNGYNLIGDGNATGAFNQPTDQTGVTNPLLGSLANNGGPTKTHALLPGSPAIDKGDDANCPATDQRGVSRPQGSACDIGSFELKIPLTVNSTADTNDGACTGDANGCTLREAITEANASPGSDTITFELEDGPHTIALNSKLPFITDGDGLTIDGGKNQITVSGVNKYQVFVVSSGARLDVKNLTVANGDSGGGIYNQGALSVTNSTIRDNSAFYSYRYGGGIYNQGTLSVTNFTFSGNKADSGGGIYNYQATLSVTNSTFSGNYALQGGGIYNSGGTATLGNTIVANSTRGGSCRGSITDGGYNLSSDATCGFTEASSLSDTDPKIGDLADNGGPTQTHVLLAGSPAIDQGKAFETTTDQRGKTRPFDLTNVDNATGGDGSDIGAFELSNASPTAATDSYTTGEDAPLTVNASTGVLSNDTDPDDGDTLEAVLVNGPSNAASFTLNADGSFTYTPRANYNGPDSFTYKANDGTDDSNTATVNITVDPVNDAPGFAKGADQTVNEDAGAQSVPNWATNISPGPSNESGQRVSFDATNDNKSLFTAAGQPEVSPGGTLTYTPAPNASGSATISVKATDDGGTANGGVDTSAAKTFTITVSPVNDAPTVEIATGGRCATGGTSGQINLTVADVESAPSALALSATSSNQNLVPNSGLSVGGSGANRTLTVSAANRSGTATITVRAGDGQGSGTVPVTVKVGSDSTDTLGGTPGADIIFGKNGANTTTGGGGNDLLCGGNGSDVMSGGAGDDTLDGANGNDALSGNAGKDILRGGSGDDTLNGGTEADSFDGGSGTDTATDYKAAEGDARTNIP